MLNVLSKKTGLRGFIVKTRWHCAKDLGEINLCVSCYENVKKQNTKSVFTPFRITFNSGNRKERRGGGGGGSNKSG